MAAPIQLVIVHHANQFLVTDGYENRDGISAIAQGYASVLRLHEKYKIPFYLHLSGTLIETLAWNAPEFLVQAKQLREAGLLQWIGGTYAENIMTCFDEDYNRRQIQEYFQVFERHLGKAEELSWFWVPERVWETESLSHLIQDSSWPNGGYKSVLLDRRILFPVESKELTRADVDAKGPWNKFEHQAEFSLGQSLQGFSEKNRKSYLESFRLQPLEKTNLHILPISENCRYWIPPRTPQDLSRLREYGQTLQKENGEEKLLVYADDLERVAGVGGWDKTSLLRYESFLKMLNAEELPLRSVLLDENKFAKITSAPVSVDAGTFYELAQNFKAGEDYRGWSEAHGNRDAKNFLASAVRALQAVDAKNFDASLYDLAWKHLLASGYETFWNDDHQQGRKTSPWALALASHSRQVHVMIGAGLWFQQADRSARAESRDLDGDGQSELILKNDRLYAVISPLCGARLVWLFWRSDEGVKLMVGNPTDDWNFLSELNTYMQTPANHPGAFCDLLGECDFYQLEIENKKPGIVSVRLENKSKRGPVKIFSLRDKESSLQISYEFKDQSQAESEISWAFSPDYLQLLRQGISAAEIFQQPDQFIATAGTSSIELKVTRGNGGISSSAKAGHAVGATFKGRGDISFNLGCRSVKI